MYKGIAGLVILILIGCGDSQTKSAADHYSEVNDETALDYSMDWIEGSWQDSTLFGGKVTFVERWELTGANSFTGEKFQISNGNESSPTELGLVKSEGKFYYTIIEGEKQTTFVQDSLGHKYISFVNTTDKFPTNLSYHLSEDVLSISFSGMANGVFRSTRFKTIRIK